MTWYGVRHLVKFAGGYEERVTLWDAESSDDAFAEAEEEAARYAADVLDGKVVQLFQAYRLLEQEFESAARALTNATGIVLPPGFFLGQSGAEVFSLIRDSDLPPDEYIDRFFDTGAEHQDHWSADDAEEQPPQSER